MLSTPTHIVYGLIDPETLLVRYVGKSTTGLRRPKCHGLPSSLNARTRTASWVKSLKTRGLQYGIVVLAEHLPADLSDAECWWIAYGRACGWDLTNLTDGGDGCPGRVQSSEEIEKRRASLWGNQRGKGAKRSPETCAKIAAARRGKPTNLAPRPKIRINLLPGDLA